MNRPEDKQGADKTICKTNSNKDGKSSGRNDKTLHFIVYTFANKTCRTSVENLGENEQNLAFMTW